MNRQQYEEQDRKIRQAREGNPEATMRLYTDFLPLMKASIRKVGYAFLQPEDLLQVLAGEFLVALRDYDESRGTPFPGYLKSRFRYALLNEVRRWENIRCETSLDIPEEEGETWSDRLPDASPTPEEEYIIREKHNKLRTLVASLSQKERELLRLFYEERKTLRAISEETGEKISTLKVRKRRAEEKLRERWTHYEQNK